MEVDVTELKETIGEGVRDDVDGAAVALRLCSILYTRAVLGIVVQKQGKVRANQFKSAETNLVEDLMTVLGECSDDPRMLVDLFNEGLNKMPAYNEELDRVEGEVAEENAQARETQ